MNNIETLIRKYNAASAALYDAKERENELVSNNSRRLLSNETIKELSELDTLITDKKLEKELLLHNARVYMFKTLLPAALNVLKDYDGKAYGTKTREKINTAIKAVTNCTFYIIRKYDFSDAYIYMGYSKESPVNISIECAPIYENGKQEDLLPGNKINCINPDKIGLYYEKDTYIDNIPAWITALKENRKTAVKAREDLERACNKFNAYAVGKIERIYANQHFTENF